MNVLLRWYPGDAAVEFAGRLIFEISLVIGAAALLAFVAMRRRPAARHALWLGVLLSVALAPLTLAAVERAGWIWTVPRPGSLDDKPPIDAPPAAPKIADLTRDSAPQPADRTRAADSWESTDGNRSAVNSETRTRIVAVSSRPADVWRALASAATFVWLAGMIFLLSRLFRGHRQVRRLLSDVQPVGPGRVDKSLGIAAATLGAGRLPPIVTSSAVAGPVVAGLVRPTVVLPADFVMRAGISQLADVLVHECSHALRWDLWVGLVQRLVQLAFWPHPLVNFMNRSLSRAREEVCDNYVLRRGDAVGYAQTLLELAGQYDARPAPGATLAIFSPRWKLEDRVAGLLDPQRYRATRVGPAKFLALVALLVAAGSALAAGRFDDPEPKGIAAAQGGSPLADEKPGTTVAAALRESRAWYILSQTDANSLLLGMPQRLGRASDPARRDGPSWRGVDGGGSVELDIDVEGEAKGEIFVGFFADPRWWLAKPVQVRRFAGPGRYTIDRLPPGNFQIGAMIGELPRPASLGVHRTWPAPIAVTAGKTTRAELRVSHKFKDNVWCQGPALNEGFAGKWKKMDPAKTITVRTADHAGDPVPFCRITLGERGPDDPTKVHKGHELGTDDRGQGYFELSVLFSLYYERYDFVPETMTSRCQYVHETKVFDSRNGPFFVERTWDDFPVGSGKVRGRVHDQHGRPLTEYFLNMTRDVGADPQTNGDSASYYFTLPVIDSEGRFEVKDLAAGTHKLMVRHFDHLTHVWGFDGRPKVTIPDDTNAEVEIDIEVEAKELRYGRAVFDDGQPVHPGGYTAWLERDPKSRWDGECFSVNTEKDGSFRVAFSQAERRQHTMNSAGPIEVYAYGDEDRIIAEARVPFEKLSKDPKQPTKVVLPRPNAKNEPGEKIGAERNKAPAANDKVIAAIENLGGTVEIDEKSPGKPIIGIELSSQKVTDDDLKVVEGLSSLRRLNLNWTQIGDAGLEHIKGITTLESLYLERCANVTDPGLAHLNGLTNLTHLDIPQTSVTNAGIVHLKNLTKLQSLDLTGIPVSDEGAKHLHGLKDLKLLFFCRFGDNDLRAPLVSVAAVRELQSLLPNCKIIHEPPNDRKAAEAEMRRRVEESTREEEARKERVARLIKNGFIVRNIREAVVAIQQLPAAVGKRAEVASEVEPGSEGPDEKSSIVDLKEYQPGDKVVFVDLANFQINDEFAAHLRFLMDLEILDLQKTPITDAALAHLERLEKLNVLHLGGTKITDNGLAHLQRLTKIEELWLLDTRVTDAGLMHLKGMENLKDLALNNTQVTDAGLEQLQAFKNLETLQLDGTKVTDAGLVHLLGLTKLKWLGLRRTKVTDSGVAVLQKALPDLKIRHRGS
jgi:internalin A